LYAMRPSSAACAASGLSALSAAAPDAAVAILRTGGGTARRMGRGTRPCPMHGKPRGRAALPLLPLRRSFSAPPVPNSWRVQPMTWELSRRFRPPTARSRAKAAFMLLELGRQDPRPCKCSMATSAAPLSYCRGGPGSVA
jgi:hypothetical protein